MRRFIRTGPSCRRYYPLPCIIAGNSEPQSRLERRARHDLDIYFVTRTRRGNAAVTRKPKVCFLITSPRAPICPSGDRATSSGSPPNSTTAPANASTGLPPPKHSTDYCPPHQRSRCVDRLLHRPLPVLSGPVTMGAIDRFGGGLLMAGDTALTGGVPLAGAIAALRVELMSAWTDAQDKSLRFRVAPVELTLEAAVTWTGTGTAGIKWWLLEAGGEVSREKAVTQTIKLTLDPVTLDAQGNPVSIFIDDDDTDTPNGARSISLDAGDD